MIDLADAAFLVGLGLVGYSLFVLAGWLGITALAGAVIMAFGLLRQWPRRG